jgi:hypothetical protein
MLLATGRSAQRQSASGASHGRPASLDDFQIAMRNSESAVRLSTTSQNSGVRAYVVEPSS